MFGTGSQLIDTQAVQEALQSRGRGQSTPQLSQVSGASPTSQAITQTPQPQGGLPKPQNMGTQGMPVQAGNPEAQLIIKALGDRLKTLGNLGM